MADPHLQWPLQADRTRFYGNPSGATGKLDPRWEAANVVRIEFPWDAVLAWDPHTRVKTVRIHRLCAQSLARVLDALWRAANRNQATIRDWGLDQYGGAFEYRLARGSKQLSSHSWACAIDLDPVRNGFGNKTPRFANYPQIIEAFDAEGWTWGGRWSKPDGMHFQAARVA